MWTTSRCNKRLTTAFEPDILVPSAPMRVIEEALARVMRKGLEYSRRQFVRGAAIAATSFCMPGARLAHAATAIAADGTKLFHEVTGNGSPIILLHETARTYRSFDLQVAALKDSFQCIA